MSHRQSVYSTWNQKRQDPGDRAFWGVGLRPLTFWDCGFEFRRRHGCFSLV